MPRIVCARKVDLQKKNSGGKKRTCFACGKSGHFAKDCKVKNGGKYAESTTAMLTVHTALGVSFENREENSDSWILDSGCTKHMTNRKENFVSFTSERGTVKVGNDETIQSLGYGKVKVTAIVKGKKRDVVLSHVLYAPDLIYNLISMSQARRNNFRIIIDANNKKPDMGMLSLFHKPSGEVKMVGIETNSGLYRAVVKVRQEEANVATNKTGVNWHERLGHCSRKTLQATLPHVNGIGEINEEEGKMCESCVLGKITRMPRKRREGTGVTKPVERVYTDVIGPMRHQSIGKAKYFVTLLDEYSGYSMVRFMVRKNETAERLKEMICEMENLFTSKVKLLSCVNRNSVKWVRSDGGGEYVGHQLQDWFKRRGIMHEVTTAYSPESNGSAERLNRSLLDMARTMMLSGVDVKEELWAEAINTACFIRNRLITQSCKESCTPYEVIHKHKPDLGNVRKFGCKAYVFKPTHARSGKFDARAVPGMLVGYCKGDAYRVLISGTQKITETKDVTFDESVSGSTDDRENYIEFDMADPKIIFDDRPHSESDNIEESREVSSNNETETQEVPILHNTTQAEDEPRDGNVDDDTLSDDELDPLTHYPGTRRSVRSTAGVPPERYTYDHAYITLDTPEPNKDIPKTYKEALHMANADDWVNAMKFEIQSLTKLDTWRLVRLPKGRKMIRTKWVYDIKRDRKGNIIRYKARLVAKGFSQIPGVDFTEVFSPVIKYPTIRLLFAISVHYGWRRSLLDIKNAFVNAPLQEEIYVQQPEGFELSSYEGYVYRLNKALYGLRQASREWYAFLDRFLTRLGCTKSDADQNLYLLKSQKGFVILLVYVDDIVLLSSSKACKEKVIEAFEREFEMRVADRIDKFLGITIEDNGDTVKMHNAPMVDRILKYFNMTDCRAATTPLPAGLDLSMGEKNEVTETTPYRTLVGALMHLANTVRPDIAFSVNYLARFMHKPTKKFWTAGKHILRYLQGTKSLGIVYSKKHEHKIKGFSDADWAQEKPSRKSVSGYVFLSAEGAVSWRSKQQSVVAQSSKEAEFIALAFCIREALWLQKFEEFFDRILIKGEAHDIFNITLGEDNMGCIRDAQTPVISDLSKHVDIKYQFLVDHVRRGNVKLQFVPTNEMLADILTKNLKKVKFGGMIRMINMA